MTPFLLAGEERPGPAEADGHLVGDQQRVVPAGQLAEPAQIALGMDDHPRRPLHQRLDDDGGDLAGMAPQEPLDLAQAGDRAGRPRQAERAAVAVRARRAEGREQQRAEHRVEPLDAADADVAERVAVVGVRRGRGTGSARGSGSAFCRQYWKAILRATSTAVAPSSEKKTRVRPVGSALDQPPGQLDRRRVGDAQQRRVRDLVELVAEGRVERGMAMAVDVAPERADAVEVATALDVEQVDALAAVDDQRVGRRPVGQRRERVPEVGAGPSSRSVSAETGSSWSGHPGASARSSAEPDRSSPARRRAAGAASPLTTATSTQPVLPIRATRVPGGRSP